MALSDEALAAVDPRFLLDFAKLDRLEQLVSALWPEAIAPADLSSPGLWQQCAAAHDALLAELGIGAAELGY